MALREKITGAYSTIQLCRYTGERAGRDGTCPSQHTDLCVETYAGHRYLSEHSLLDMVQLWLRARSEYRRRAVVPGPRGEG